MTVGSDTTRVADVWRVLDSVQDPEIPVLSVVDLGIVRYVRTRDHDSLHVGLTPTYSGCPATEVIRANVRNALAKAGYAHVTIDEVLSPPWTSDWLTAEGRRRLAHFGIAPPAEPVSSPKRLLASHPISCPRCAGEDTELVSEFGSTPCKAHYRCKTCLEPFDYFKCI